MTYTKQELLSFNEKMLGRGVPNQDDGIGYNKADYGACSTYYNGLSNAQYSDLAKRLVKYCNTQLGLDRDKMKKTAEEFGKLSLGKDRSDGISLKIQDDKTIVSFRYNEKFINAVRSLPIQQRKYDSDNKAWLVKNESVMSALKSLSKVGADISGALEYVMNNNKIVGCDK